MVARFADHLDVIRYNNQSDLTRGQRHRALRSYAARSPCTGADEP